MYELIINEQLAYVGEGLGVPLCFLQRKSIGHSYASQIHKPMRYLFFTITFKTLKATAENKVSVSRLKRLQIVLIQKY